MKSGETLQLRAKEQRSGKTIKSPKQEHRQADADNLVPFSHIRPHAAELSAGVGPFPRMEAYAFLN
jgi:hypothetical protein